MNTPDSPNRELENAVLLAQSGELSPAELDSLQQARRERPDLDAWAKESLVLQSAGRTTSEELVPPLPELNRERILKTASRPESKALPRLLALAAVLVLALGLLPHLSRHFQAPPPTLTTRIEPIQEDFQSVDPLLEDLESLEDQLAVFTDLSMDDSRILEDENDWAELLLSLEEPI